MSEFIAHFHPVIVHLPIGILMLACIFQWLGKKERFSSLHAASGISLLIGMITAILAVVTGWLLSRSDDYDEQLANTHQWFGISVAVLSIVLYYLHRRGGSHKIKLSASIVLFILILITGHFGGSLTHGTDYLTKSFKSSDSPGNMARKPLPNVQEAVAYTDIIQPMLQTKCYTCHGKTKQKGGLRMDQTDRLMKGGKDGEVIIPGDPEKSEMIRRLLLPREDEDHMPPKEKSQLNEQDIALIHWWIASGAPFDKKVKELQQPEKIKPVLLSLQNKEEKKITPDIPSTAVERADDSAIKKLKDIGVVVMPVAQNTNYLVANFVTVSSASDNAMRLLLPLKKQLVWLKLANTSITDSALQVIAQFPNLMRLNLDHTIITDTGLVKLKSLQNLRYLNLVGTRVTAKGILELKDLKNLQSIYLYQTAVAKSDWIHLAKAFPKAWIDSGGYSLPLLSGDTSVLKAAY